MSVLRRDLDLDLDCEDLKAAPLLGSTPRSKHGSDSAVLVAVTRGLLSPTCVVACSSRQSDMFSAQVGQAESTSCGFALVRPGPLKIHEVEQIPTQQHFARSFMASNTVSLCSLCSPHHVKRHVKRPWGTNGDTKTLTSNAPESYVISQTLCCINEKQQGQLIDQSSVLTGLFKAAGWRCEKRNCIVFPDRRADESRYHVGKPGDYCFA